VAGTQYEAARAIFAALGDRGREAQTLTFIGGLAQQQGHLSVARERYSAVIRRARGVGDRRVLATAVGNLALLEQERGDLELADEHLAEAIGHARAVGDQTLEGHLLGYRSGLALEQGATEWAQEWNEAARAILDRIGDARLGGLFLALYAVIEGESGRFAAAEEALGGARERLDRVADPSLLATLTTHERNLDVARARRLRDQDQQAEAAGLVARAAEHLRAIEAAPEAASDDQRFASRLLSRALAQEAIVVHPDGSFARISGGALIDLRKRAPLRRLLVTLADAHQREPGVPVTSDALLESGWPDERMLHDAAQNRLQVALTSLRKVGLRDVLMRDADGYFLDPSRVVLRRDPR
jgi:tetratricopeptide (TPR) repeat protein